jgi:mono/diheme cytochrome c family protein
MTRKVVTAVFVLGGLCLTISCSSPSASSSAAETKAAKPTAAITPAVLEQGKGIYKAKCAACHGETGRGDGPAAGVMKPAPRDHTDRAYMSTLSDEELAKVIQMGGAIKGKPLMPSNPDLRGDTLAAVVAYTRSLSTGTTK